MFIVSLKYKKEISEVEKFIEQHIIFLNKYYEKKKFIVSGRKNPRNGGIILVRDMTNDSLMDILKEDPFYVNEIANYEITEFIPTKFDEHFSYFID